VGLWAKPGPDRPIIYKQFAAVKCFSAHGLLPSPSSTCLLPPGQGGHGLGPPVFIPFEVVVLNLGMVSFRNLNQHSCI